MNKSIQSVDEIAAKNVYVELTIDRWYFLLSSARQELHAAQWLDAEEGYRDAYTQAELLLVISNCKSCAIKGYIRTLVEYCYVLRRSNQVHALTNLVSHAWHTLNTYTTEALALKLLRPLRTMECATTIQCEMFINELFAEDAAYLRQVH